MTKPSREDFERALSSLDNRYGPRIEPIIREALRIAAEQVGEREKVMTLDDERSFAELRALLYWIAIEYGGRYCILKNTMEDNAPGDGTLDLSTKETGDIIIRAIRQPLPSPPGGGT